MPKIDRCHSTVKTFIEKRHHQGRPLLLAFSGGVDSLALFSLLIQLRKTHFLDVHVAHVDHGWRPESSQQAASLKKMVEELGAVFHLHTLSPPEESSNLEEKARLERLSFFRKIYGLVNAQALIFAHQADDLAETVLKRIGEGADLFYLHGMQEVGQIDGMDLWRPLLKIPKKELLSYLKKNHLVPIEDQTNRDCHFFRARMREKIFPYFNEQFGKETTSNFVRLSSSVIELKDYFCRKVEKYFERKQQTQEGAFFDLNPLFPLEKAELKFFLKELALQEKLFLSHEQKELAAEQIMKKSPCCVISDKGRKVVVRKAILMILE